MASFAYSVLGLSVLALLLAGYLGQKYLPPPTPKVVGIDLGTTYSCVGVYQAVTGEVRVIPDEDGHKCIPSIVAFSEDEVLIGYKAAAQSEHNPQATIYDAKRFIGQKMSVDELQREGARYPFKMFVDENHEVQYNLDHLNIRQPEEPTKVKDAVLPRVLTPSHIGSYIVRTLKETAERNLSAPVVRAVMAVPAEFSERQRNFTKQAAALAGLDVLRIINEPTAAALAYGLHKKSGVRTVMVVDLGGGTLDVSLLQIQGGMFVTVAMAGNSHLGGQDFTHRLYRYLLDLLENEHQRKVTDPEDLQTIRIAAENAKLHLTYHSSAEIDIKLHSLGNKKRWKHTITVEEFNKLNSALFEKALEPIQRILEDRELLTEDVDEIVLVGGSTRIPKIRQIIRDYFDKDLNVEIDPELAVTLGVSIQAGILGGMWPLEVSAIEVPLAVQKIKLH